MSPDLAAASAGRVPLAEHRADVAALLAGRFRTARISLAEARPGMVLAADVRAVVDVPAADNSQMDGYAVRAADLSRPGRETGGKSGTRMPVGPPIPAGQAPEELGAGQARPIMTGAPVPRGADLVVPIEETVERDFGAATVTLRPTDVRPGRSIRAAGSDTHRGDVIAREGAVLSAARIAHLAASGAAFLTVRTPLRILVMSTGSEVVPVGADGAALPPGAAFDANGPGLVAALRELGAETLGPLHVRDDGAALVDRIRAQARTAAADGAPLDLVVTSGGVSAGAYEPVRHAAALPGVSLSFPKVALQPGGPQGIGALELAGPTDDGAPDDAALPWIALPGNPVSALLSAELLLRPALGAVPRQVLRLPLRLEDPTRPEPSPTHLEQYRRARVLTSGDVRLVGGPSSHLVGALAAATALVRVPVGIDQIHDGDLLETILLPEGER